MNELILCSQNFPSLKNFKSPFSKAIVFSYYDGPTSGIVDCCDNLTSYKFEMLEWDATQDIRIFTLAEMPPKSFVFVTETLSQWEKPKLPLWVPVWEFESNVIKEKIEAEIDNILKETSPPQIVVATVNILDEILSAKKISPTDINSTRNWFSFLNLEK